MERVLIVAKTRMKSGVCVSGLALTSNKNIRLIPKNRFNQPLDTNFDIGQIWNIEYRDIPNLDPPHVEDVTVLSQQYVSYISNMRTILMQRIRPWHGGPENLFDKTLIINQSKCYISRSGQIPDCSTGYWLPDRPLTLMQNDYNKLIYTVEHKSMKNYKLYHQVLSLPFVGYSSPIKQIPPGTLLRVSLARWFLVTNEERCYLQLSGWYM